MFYFHIADLLPEKGGMMTKEAFERYYKIPGTLKNRYVRYMKTNLGKKKALGKLMELIATEDFINLEQADKKINWDQVPSVLI